MAEPLKNLFSPDVIAGISQNLSRTSKDFDASAFLKVALNNLDDLELSERSNQIVTALETAYTGGFEATVGAMLAALHPDTEAGISEMQMDETGVANWAVMPLAGYVARHGLDMPEFSLNALLGNWADGDILTAEQIDVGARDGHCDDACRDDKEPHDTTGTANGHTPIIDGRNGRGLGRVQQGVTKGI